MRGLEKRLSSLVRASILKMVEEDAKRVRIGKREVEDILGQARFKPKRAQRGRGVVTGLAWTAMGATLSIESSKVHTLNRGFKLTGQLGEVMKESAEIAHSYVVAHLREFGCEPDFFDMSMVHLHVPEGQRLRTAPVRASPWRLRWCLWRAGSAYRGLWR